MGVARNARRVCISGLRWGGRLCSPLLWVSRWAVLWLSIQILTFLGSAWIRRTGAD